MVFYLTNVTNAVNLSQPSVFIGGGLHALIRILGGYSHARFSLLFVWAKQNYDRY